MNMKKRWITAGLVVSVFLLILAFVAIPQHKQKKFDEGVREIAELATDDNDEDNVAGDTDDKKPPVNFEKLQKVNKDVVAWIEIPGTDISYPILQSDKDNEDFYLKHDIYKNANAHGAIYMQNVNKDDFSDFDTILYGHNMRDGSMFRQLHSYWNEGFFAGHRIINIYTPDECLRYKVYAIYPTDNNLIPEVYNHFKTKADRQDYLDAIRFSNGNRDKTMDPGRTDKLLTLSTCMGDSNRRLILQAVLEQKNSDN